MRTRVTELLGVETRSSRRRWAGSPGRSWPRRSPTPAASASSRRRRASSTRSGARSRKMRDLTDKPFGVNIAQLFVRDPSIVDFVVEQGVRFVTTSAGDPTKYTDAAEGRRAHRLPRRADAARRAEGGRRRRRRARRRGRRGRRLQEPDATSSTMVLLPLVALEGRRADHRRRRHLRRRDRWPPRSRSAPRACRWARRMVSAAESPVHDNWKQAIVARRRDRHRVPQPLRPARPARAAHRAQRRGSSARSTSRMTEFGTAHGPLLRRRHGGGARARRSGRRAHRRGGPVAEIIDETMEEFGAVAKAMADLAG